MAGLAGLPIVGELSDARHALFKTSHNWDHAHSTTALGQVGTWLGHKVLTVISVPANILEMGVCGVGFAASACTLGALKVAIYALTLGSIKPSFSTGCLWFGERSLHGCVNVCWNAGELLYDLGDMAYQGYRLTRWVAGQLHLGNLFNVIFHEIGRAFDFVGGRMVKGVNKSLEVESPVKGGIPQPFYDLDEMTKKHRIDFGSSDRSLESIFKHYVLSVVNLPINGVIAIGSAGASVVLSAAFTAKVILYSTTNIDIPVPTYAGHALSSTGSALYNIAADTSNDVADVFVLMYKTSSAIGLTQVMTTALRVVLYIPEAIFS